MYLVPIQHGQQEKKSLTAQISGETQLEELRRSTLGLKKKLPDCRVRIKPLKYKAELETVKLDAALDKAIITAKGRNPKAIKALLEPDKLKLKEDGTVEGLDIAALKTSDPYLFDEVQQSGNDGNNQPQSGLRLGSGANHGGSNNPDYDKMSDDEYYAAKAKENKS